MRVGTIYYDKNMDETQIKWNDNFIGQDYITQMDALRDTEYVVQMAIEEIRVKNRKEKVLK